MGRGKQGAFHVKVAVDKPGDDKPAPAIKDLPPLVGAQADDGPFGQGHIGFHDFTGEDVDHPSAFKDQVGRDFAPGGSNNFFEFFGSHGKIF